MSDLPAGWKVCILDDVIDVLKNGLVARQNKEGVGLPLSRIETIADGTINPKRIGYAPELKPEDAEDFLLKVDDILFSHINSPAHLGKTAIYKGRPEILYHGMNLLLIRPRTHVVNSHYLEYGFRFLRISGVFSLNAQHAVNQASINQKKLRNLEFPLAPLDEQKRITEKLDSLLARVDSCQTHLERVPQILKRFRQSVLAAATSGRLTEDWREERTDLPEYRSVTLREVASSFNYGTSAKSSKSGKIPVLRMGNIQDGKLDWTDLVFTSDKDEIEKYKLVKGDVLFNRTNSPEWVGKTAVYKGEQPAIYAGYLIRVKCGDELLPDFINYCLNSPMGRDWRWRVKSDGVSQSNINAQKLADFEFELPPVEEQAEIVRRVEKLFAYAERLEARYYSASEHVERLTPSLLAKAFRGELVGQDSNDEPVEKLLERIKKTKADDTISVYKSVERPLTGNFIHLPPTVELTKAKKSAKKKSRKR